MKKKLLFITNSIKKSFKNSFDYEGRSTRAEYWILTILSQIFCILCVLVFVAIEAYVLNQSTSIIMNFGQEFDKGLTLENIQKKYSIRYDMFLILIFYLSYAIFILPVLSLSVRRLHDFGKPGFLVILYLMIYVPLEIIDMKDWTIETGTTKIGYFLIAMWIAFFLYCSQKSDKRKNQYGPVPKIK